MPAFNIPLFQRSLLAWYRKNARKLPWRKTRDPYKIWVSEIMLQQTQVQTVIPYYERWIQKFPTVQALAKAPSADVMRHWAGLGYYRRARMLHEGAKFVLAQQRAKGKWQRGKNNPMPSALCPLPRDVASLMKIPGIGRYTAGAVASIAFEEKVPVLDGNVIRILTRLHAMPDDISAPKTIQKLWGLAENLLGGQIQGPVPFSAGDFNQALMELGATVCFPRNPECGRCPVSNLCKAYKQNAAEQYPVNKKKEMAEKLKTAALILRNNGRVLLQKQPENARWGGLWMFPHWKSKKQMMSEVRCQKSDLKHRMTVKHGFTKYRIELEVYEHRAKGKGKGEKPHPRPYVLCPMPGKWVRLSELEKLAFPSPHQKVVTEILENGTR